MPLLVDILNDEKLKFIEKSINYVKKGNDELCN